MTIPSGLRRCAVFDHMTPEQLAQVAQCASPVRFPAGVTVLKEGDASRDAYVVQQGAVRITRQTAYGTFELAVLGEGQLFGETSDLYRRLVRRVGPLPTLVEWDEATPDYPTVVAESDTARAMPKSMTFTWPVVVIMMLPGLMSRCTTPARWEYSRAVSTPSITRTAAAGSSGPSWMMSLSRRPSTNSMMMNGSCTS